MHGSKRTLGALVLVVVALGLTVTAANLPTRAAGQAALGFTLPAKEFGQYTPGSQILVSGPWGTGPGQFGKTTTQPLWGPASFDVDAQERIHILDRINGRVQRFDGKGAYLSSFAVRGRPDDIAVAEDGSIYVMDSQEHKVFRHRQDGSLLQEFAIAREIHFVRRVFAAGQDVTVQSMGSPEDPIVKFYQIVAGGQPVGTANQLSTRQAKGPTRATGLALASTVRADKRAVEVTLQQRGGPERKITVSVERPALGTPLLAADRAGILYLGVAALRENPKPRTAQITIVAFTQEGQYLGRAETPNPSIMEAIQTEQVSPAGKVYQMQITADGVRILSWPLTK